ncbi:extracellular solute-binding protein [Intestinirhabdus alba]|uniref:Extracellular solute-binding protein n=1 Tax=Intestinirhabdus alba TaxID=2899544 RepID=A0A6L6ITH0_9ENTR|nr:extracellular solute-binding protein [Intestinirhabdus alba]MTH48023.1 extracellular solute-binding protein [Intestinirhabdus alba]
MATIKDIARMAGVSHGTVSNVLNGRGNVSVEKIEAVRRAASAMGYQLNAQAQSLRASKSNDIALVLPDIDATPCHRLYSGIARALPPGTALNLYLTGDRPAREREILAALATRAPKAVIVASCLEEADDWYRALRLPPRQIAFVWRRPRNAEVSFSHDFFAAGEEIARRIAAGKHQHVGVLCDPLHYACAGRFVAGIRAALPPDARLTIIDSPDEEADLAAFDFFSAAPPDAFITQDNEKLRSLTRALALGHSGRPGALYSLSDSEPPADAVTHYYQLDYGYLGQRIVSDLEEDKALPPETLLANRGFALPPLPPRTQAPEETLNLLILPSPSTQALKKLLPHFARQTGIRVNLAVHPWDEVFTILSSPEQLAWYDLLRIDVACLPWFARQRLRPLADIADDLPALAAPFPPALVEQFCRVNDETLWALPFDASTQLLFYRRDLFSDPTLSRMYYEKHGEALRVPQRFSEFDRIARFFGELHEPGNPRRPSGSSITLGNAGLIATEYLLRYYAEGGRLLHPDRPPSLEPERGVAALEGYLAQLDIASHLKKEWWSASVESFRDGQLAMLIVYSNLFNPLSQRGRFPAPGFAPVPGAQPQIGGGALGMSCYSEKKTQAAQFFRWLYSPEIVQNLVLLGGNSAHPSVYANQRILQRYPWLDLLRDGERYGRRESLDYQGRPFNLRLAENIIGQGVSHAINNIMPPGQAIAFINQRLRSETQG